jgi:hypothetical protein
MNWTIFMGAGLVVVVVRMCGFTGEQSQCHTTASPRCSKISGLVRGPYGELLTP